MGAGKETSRMRPKSIAVSERELQALAEDDLEALEEGLSLVDHYVQAGTGVIDSLCLDRDGNPVVIEYKAVDDADQDALIQALDYAAWVDRNPDTVSRFINEKRPELLRDRTLGEIRIILVAPSFTPRTQNAVRMVEPDLTLRRYVCFEHPHTGRWIHYETVYDSRRGRPREPGPQAYRIDDHFTGNYSRMRPLFDVLVKRVQAELSGVNVYAKKYYIAFQRNFIFAVVYNYTNKIQVGVMLRSPQPSARLGDATDWGWSRITHSFTLTSERDIDDEAVSWLKESYANS